MKQLHKAALKLARQRYTRQIRQEWRTAIPGMVLPGIGIIFTSYIPPLVIARLLIRFGHTRPTFSQVLPYLFLFAGIWLAGEVIWRIAFLCINSSEGNGMRNLYIEGMNELMQKDLSFFHDNFAGALTKKVLGYGRNFELFMDTLTFSILSNVIPIGFAMVVLWRFSPWLVVALLGLMTLTGAIVMPLMKRRRQLTNAREKASNHMASHVADVIGNIDAVQTFAHEEIELTTHHRNTNTYAERMIKAWNYHTIRMETFISPLYVGANVFGLAIAVVLGKNAASLAATFITFNYFASATRVLWEFNRIYRNLESSLTEAAQFTQLLLTPPALQERDDPINLNVTTGAVAFQNVDFGYDKKDGELLFKGLDLQIAPGEKVALVGHSGGGKTTVTKLLLRFMDVNGGAITIDGQNIADARLGDLRRAISYVPQEPTMFHRSIMENIRYGRPEATDAEVIVAAQKAHAHEFVSKLKKGYETMVGERGIKLSGGQRQRIAIARAILKDAPILVLDEATSALDSESEKLIQTALWELMNNRTAIAIAHRLSTIQKMDRIIVLDNGQIVEQGSHAQLIKHGGVYATLWAHQSGGFIEE